MSGYDGQAFEPWAEGIGWAMVGVPIAVMVLVMLIQVLRLGLVSWTAGSAFVFLSFYLSVSLSVPLSLYLSLFLSLYHSFSFSLSLSLSLSLCFSLSVSLCVSLCLSLSLSVSLSVSFSLSVSLCLSLSVSLSVYNAHSIYVSSLYFYVYVYMYPFLPLFLSSLPVSLSVLLSLSSLFNLYLIYVFRERESLYILSIDKHVSFSFLFPFVYFSLAQSLMGFFFINLFFSFIIRWRSLFLQYKSFTPTESWGPSLPEDRTGRYSPIHTEFTDTQALPYILDGKQDPPPSYNGQGGYDNPAAAEKYISERL